MHSSIRKRLTATFIVLAVVPLFMVGIILTIKIYTVQKQEAIALQLEVAERLSTHVVNYVTSLEKSLRAVLYIYDFKNFDLKRQRQILSVLQAHHDEFETLVLINNDGRVKLNLSKLELYQDAITEKHPDQEAFKIPVTKKDSYYGPVRFRKSTGEPYLLLAVPINDLSTGESEGFLVADIRLKKIWNLIAGLHPQSKGSGYIVDIKNRVVAHRNPSVILRGTFFSPPSLNGIHKGLNGQTTVLVKKTIKLGEQQFHILVERPISEAFALAFETTTVIIFALVTLSIVAAWMGISAVRKIVFPVQNLAEIARQIQAGEFTKKAKVDTHDEIGDLAGAFNSMTKQLTESMANLAKEVSDRKRAELALKESEEKYRILFQTFPLGISITDKHGNIIETNRKAESLLGISFNDHFEKNYTDTAWQIVRSDGTPMPVEEYPGVKAKNENRTVNDIEMGYVKKQQEVIWLSVTAAPIPLEKYGEAIAYADITERKRVERELEKYRNHLEELVKERSRKLQAAQDELLKREKLSVLGQLTATVSHELRNPLGVMRTSSYYLSKRVKNRDEKIDKHLARIDEQIGICDRLVEDLLEYTRGKLSEKSICRFNALVEEVFNQIQVPQSVKIIKKLADELPSLELDHDKIRRTLINLIQNAILAVTEKVKKENNKKESDFYEPTVQILTEERDGSIFLEILDNGIGMNQETTEKAFDPLFTTRARGTGLGLSIVKKIIEEHGGTVVLESSLDHFTKVSIKLPITAV